MVLEKGFSMLKFCGHRHHFVCIAGRHMTLAINELGHFKVILAFEGAPVIDSLRLGWWRFREKTIYLPKRDSMFITRYSYTMFGIT